MFVQWKIFVHAELNSSACWCCSHNIQWLKPMRSFLPPKPSYPDYLVIITELELWSFPCGSAGKKSACHVGGLGLIPGLGRFLGEGKGYPLQYSGLENSMDWTVHWKACQTWLSDFHFHRTVDTFAFRCYPIRRKGLGVRSFIPHTRALTVSCPKIMW